MEVVACDITRVDAPAIVNSANDYLILGSGTAEQIRDAGFTLSACPTIGIFSPNRL